MLLIELFPKTVQAEKSEKSKISLELQIQTPVDAAPTQKAYKVQMDPKVCGTDRQSLSMVVKDGGFLKNVAVFLEQLSNQPAENDFEPANITIENCEFNPRLIIVKPGTRISFQSNDPILYQIRSQSKLNGRKQVALPPNLLHSFIQYDEREIVSIVDDLHPWMRMYAVVEDRSLVRITDGNGKAVFKSLRPGKYRLWFWHETLGIHHWESEIEISRNTVIKFNWKPN